MNDTHGSLYSLTVAATGATMKTTAAAVLLASVSIGSAKKFYSSNEITRMLVTDNQYKAVGARANNEGGVSVGALIFAQHGEATCTASPSTAAGYVLGGCITSDENTGMLSCLQFLSYK